jgi:hypothetical protein
MGRNCMIYVNFLGYTHEKHENMSHISQFHSCDSNFTHTQYEKGVPNNMLHIQLW